eukprot:IDg16018t1
MIQLFPNWRLLASLARPRDARRSQSFSVMIGPVASELEFVLALIAHCSHCVCLMHFGCVLDCVGATICAFWLLRSAQRALGKSSCRGARAVS